MISFDKYNFRIPQDIRTNIEETLDPSRNDQKLTYDLTLLFVKQQFFGHHKQSVPLEVAPFIQGPLQEETQRLLIAQWNKILLAPKHALYKDVNYIVKTPLKKLLASPQKASPIFSRVAQQLHEIFTSLYPPQEESPITETSIVQQQTHAEESFFPHLTPSYPSYKASEYFFQFVSRYLMNVNKLQRDMVLSSEQFDANFFCALQKAMQKAPDNKITRLLRETTPHHPMLFALLKELIKTKRISVNTLPEIALQHLYPLSSPSMIAKERHQTPENPLMKVFRG